MTGISRTLLHGLLAVTLLAGGLPAWAGSTPAVNGETAVAADSGDQGSPNCHTDGAPVEAAASEPMHDCCETDEPCEHDDCRCVCPALSLVVPIPATVTAWTAPHSPAWMLSASSPIAITSNLLRPPRA